MSEMLTTPSMTAAPRSNRIAIVGFVIALVGLLAIVGFVIALGGLLSSWMIVPGALGFFGFVFGHMDRENATQGAEHGRLALWAMVLGALAAVVSASAVIAVIVLGGGGGSESLNRDPAWSPDGARIAFSSNREGNLEIYVMKILSGVLSNRLGRPTGARSPSRAPGR